MALQSLPPSAEAYAASNTVEIGAAVSAVQRLWERVDVADFDGSYEAVEPTLLSVVDTAQDRVTVAAQAYVPRVLAEQGIQAPAPSYSLRPGALVGVAGDGRPTASLMSRAVVGAKQGVAGGMSPAAALEQSGRWLTTAVGTVLSDTGRNAERVAAGARRVDVFVRMLVPPSCGRCVILAGKISGSRDAFRRHPKCDCRNVPSSEDVAGDLTTNPFDYLDSLDDDALARALGSRANARAFRDGADENQIVNAYRSGIQQAQVYGRDVKYSTEGTTRSGLAGSRMRRWSGESARRGETVTRYTRTGPEARTVVRNVARAPRLMPETIYQIATDPADAQRLLRMYGWIL